MQSNVTVYWLSTEHSQFTDFNNLVDYYFKGLEVYESAQATLTETQTGNFLEFLSIDDKVRTLSHLGMIKHWVDTCDTDYALFLEDTIDIEMTSAWPFSLNEVCARIPSSFKVAQLHVIRQGGISRLRCTKWCPDNWGAGAYLMSRAYAKSLVEKLFNELQSQFVLEVIGDASVRPYVESVLFTPAAPDVYSIPLFAASTEHNILSSDLDLSCALEVKSLWNSLVTLEELFEISTNAEINSLEQQLKIAPSRDIRAIVVDNFFEDPYSVREFALNQEYFDDEGYIGRRTRKQFLTNDLKERFESLLGKKITKWEEYGMNGRFQHNWAGEKLVYHCDEQRYAAIIYLTPNAPFETGTSTWAHKATRIHHNSHPEIMSCFNQRTFVDRTPYELVDTFGNVFNRLVIFDGGCIHSASEYFGDCLENCRLWQMFFFDAE